MVNWSHIKARYGARLVQFEDPSVLHRSMDGQVKLLKRAEKDQVVQEVIRADSVRQVLRLPSASRTQVATPMSVVQEMLCKRFLGCRPPEGRR